MTTDRPTRPTRTFLSSPRRLVVVVVVSETAVTAPVVVTAILDNEATAVLPILLPYPVVELSKKNKLVCVQL
ncbi:unnamed protein product [Soboliphyme baturini]|uniref:Secreted protein n=1 Tax=Soboliphyme baturini TaxID=241478 RepID=A0A183IFC3_9BILA|nr:unnamed protein product [Soboliphyme baturini]